jgi:hypothetical protein
MLSFRINSNIYLSTSFQLKKWKWHSEVNWRYLRSVFSYAIVPGEKAQLVYLFINIDCLIETVHLGGM